MVVEGDREVQQQEKLEDQEGEMVDNDEVEQRRKESQPLIVRDTVVEVLLGNLQILLLENCLKTETVRWQLRRTGRS